MTGRILQALSSFVLATVFLGSSAVAQQAIEPASQAIDEGQRVFTCAHSFHFFVPLLLPDVAKKAGVEGHTQVGMSAIGGSRIIQHWDVPDARNEAKRVLREGKVDVLTLSPIFLPDEGIEKFATLALEHHPDVRIFVQENWLPYDEYDRATPLKNRPVDHNAPTAESLRKEHEPYFKDIDEHVRSLNEKLGRKDRPAVFVAPVGQAVVALREKILAGEAPGLKEQKELFTDPIGHPHQPIQILATYVYYSLIYRKSPVGIPTPDGLSPVKYKEADQLNRLLQELAWEAVTSHPLSGVTADEPAKEGAAP